MSNEQVIITITSLLLETENVNKRFPTHFLDKYGISIVLISVKVLLK